MKHYLITKIGAELDKRFLQKRMVGSGWTSSHFAHKFLSLGSAQLEASEHENVRVLWVDDSHPAKWGEVNN